MPEPSLEAALSYAALGLIVGFGYYMAMLFGSELPEGAPKWLATAMVVLRVAAAVAFFAWLASLGMLPILSAFAGFLVGRTIAYRALGQDP